MLQELKIGQAVDDGTGDYLREGGSKINANFTELYTELGDGKIPFPAGAWKTFTNPTIAAVFGKSYVLNTSSNEITVNLPKGTTSDYNKVIRLRDVFGTWQTNPVTVIPASGDTLKGDPKSRKFTTNLTDLEMVYCFPGRWEFVANKQLNKISAGDASTIVRKEFIATEGQTDFLKVFGDGTYNSANLQVYRRGNLLFYGNTFSADSDYGSPNGSGIGALNGVDIRLKTPCEAGDAIIVITYLDGVAQWRSTYNRLDTMILDVSKTNLTSLAGARYVDDLTTLKTINVVDLGYTITDNSGLINPNTFEVILNGVVLNQVGTAGLPMFRCEGADGVTEADCIAQNGLWVQSNTDYSIFIGDNGSIESITFDKPFQHGDVLTIKWYNNDIGTTLKIDEILDETDKKYVSATQDVTLTGGVRVTDFQNPVAPNVEPIGPQTISLTNVFNIFDLVYPIGTVYENFVNPNNPATYMGFGVWVLQGEKRVLVGWTQDNQDTLFGLNNNVLDVNGNPSHIAGGTGGTRTTTLLNENLPKTQTDEKVLIVDDNGTIVVGGCQFDPDQQGPAYDKYREDYATTNISQQPPIEISNIQPYVTVYRWMRIA